MTTERATGGREPAPASKLAASIQRLKLKLRRQRSATAGASCLAVAAIVLWPATQVPGQWPAHRSPSVTAAAKIFPGLDPAGVDDSTAALQAALNAAAKGNLTVPAGSYIVTSLTLPKDGIRMMGSGARLILPGPARTASRSCVSPRGQRLSRSMVWKSTAAQASWSGCTKPAPLSRKVALPTSPSRIYTCTIYRAMR